jgi:hypothetical protein
MGKCLAMLSVVCAVVAAAILEQSAIHPEELGGYLFREGSYVLIASMVGTGFIGGLFTRD